MMCSAIKARLLTDNPFCELKTASLGNRKRQYFVSLEETSKVLDVCSNAEWRAVGAIHRNKKKKPQCLLGLATPCMTLQGSLVGPEGLEPPTNEL